MYNTDTQYDLLLHCCCSHRHHQNVVVIPIWKRGVVDLDIPRIKAICDIAWQEDLAVVRMTDCGELLHQLADVL